MGYLAGYKGDYLGGYRGDPGLFGFIGRAAKKVGGALFGATPVGQAIGAARGIVSGGSRARGPMPQIPVPGIRGVAQRVVPGGATGYMPARKRRRMNVANPKALRKAIRRQAGFVKLAKRALQGTGYTVVTRGSRARRPVTVRESGPGSVVVR